MATAIQTIKIIKLGKYDSYFSKLYCDNKIMVGVTMIHPHGQIYGYPYGVYILSNNHRNNITEFTEEEKFAFADILKNTAGMYDSLFDIPFPYMMCIYNGPVNSDKTDDFYHFHVEFFPPMRSKEKQKYNASSETGAWAHCNPTCPEEKSEELRNAYNKFISKINKLKNR